MIVKVCLDLSLRFGQKSQAPTIARRARYGANKESAGIERRIEDTQSPAEALDARRGPGEVLRFLRAGAL